MKYNYLHDKSLNEIKNLLVAEAHPRKIVLFGSRARGEIREQSDYDLLLVVDNCDNERDINRRLYRSLLEHNIESPVDLITISSAKLMSHKSSFGSVHNVALREGVTIYG